MADYTLSAKITGDSKNYQKAVNQAEKSTESLEKSTSSVSSKVASAVKTSFSVASKAVGLVTTAMIGGISAGVKYNANIEQYQTSFEVMTGSAEKAAEVVERLKTLGAETPFEMSDLAEATQLLMNYGFTADDAITKMQMLGDISQGNAEKMQRVATAYGQMSSAGKVQLEDVKQMIEAGFNPLQEISQSTGESMASLYDRISKGTLAVDEITASMERSTSAGGRYFQSMEKQSQTLMGQFSTMKDNASQLIGSIAQSTSDEISGNLFPTINTGLADMATALSEGGFEQMGQVGGNLISSLITSIFSQAPQLVNMAVILLTSLVTGLNQNASQIGSSAMQIISALITGVLNLLPEILDLGLNLIISLAEGLVKEIPTLVSTVTEVTEKILTTLTDPNTLTQLINVALELILTLADGLLDAAPRLMQLMPQIIKNVAMALIDAFPQILQAGIELIGVLIKGIQTAVTGLIGTAVNLVASIVGVFKDTDWGELGRNIIDGIKNGINKLKDSVVNTVGNVAEEVANRFKNLLGIHSPSRVFMQFGMYTDQGFAIGVDKGAKDIYKSLENLQISSRFETILPSARDIQHTATQTVSYSADVQSGLGDYIVSMASAEFDRMANAVEKGISNMKMVADGREVSRFITSLGYKKG